MNKTPIAPRPKGWGKPAAEEDIVGHPLIGLEEPADIDQEAGRGNGGEDIDHPLDQMRVDGAETAEAHIDERTVLDGKLRRIETGVSAAHAAFEERRISAG